MNVSTLEAPQAIAAVGQPSPASRPSTAPAKAPSRPGRRTGRGTGPQARPARRAPGGFLGQPRQLRPQACGVTAPAPARTEPAAWRLTERGIALVLVTGLLIVTAALTVVGLTALRVTGERYAVTSHAILLHA